MAGDKSPAFQFYPKDFLTDERVRLMTDTEVGLYVRLLCLCWLEGSLPADPSRLAKLVHWPILRFRKIWVTSLSACFQPTSEPDRLTQKRLEEEREKQATYRRRQSDKGKASAHRRATVVQPRFNHGSTAVQPGAVQPEGNSSISYLQSPVSKEREERRVSLSPPADPFLDPDITERAGRFLERYQALYIKHRRGARYAVKPTRDYAAAVTLCQTWADDARLDQLAVIFLTSDHRFAEEGSRTVPQFLALASWCDGKLCEHEAQKKAATA